MEGEGRWKGEIGGMVIDLRRTVMEGRERDKKRFKVGFGEGMNWWEVVSWFCCGNWWGIWRGVIRGLLSGRGCAYFSSLV